MALISSIMGPAPSPIEGLKVGISGISVENPCGRLLATTLAYVTREESGSKDLGVGSPVFSVLFFRIIPRGGLALDCRACKYDAKEGHPEKLAVWAPPQLIHLGGVSNGLVHSEE